MNCKKDKKNVYKLIDDLQKTDSTMPARSSARVVKQWKEASYFGAD